MFDLEAIQTALREFHLDGWLLYDFRGSNVLARRVLQLSDDQMVPAAAARIIPLSWPENHTAAIPTTKPGPVMTRQSAKATLC